MSIQMTQDFKKTLEMIDQGENVLITGKAGTGKSTLLRMYLEQSENRNILVTAPTGVAALNIGGLTIHKTFGFRPGMYPDAIRPGGGWNMGRVSKVLEAVDILVVDEISMVRADLFDMMNLALQRVRKNDLPFGGVQLILVGDLLQLPPVVEPSEAELFTKYWSSPYFFSAQCFDRVKLQRVTLSQVWRQSDNEFVEILNQVREGTVHDAALGILNAKVDPDFQAPDDWVTVASFKRTVNTINHRRIEQLPGPILTSIAEHVGDTDGYSFGGSEELNYAVGARVMTVINDPRERFVNGSFGTIVSADESKIGVTLDHSGETVQLQKYDWEIKRPSVSGGRLGSETVGVITQFPVILAWAITIHKSQGKTIPKLFIDLKGGTTTDGQFYVALSRAVDLEHLRFSQSVERRHIRANNSLVRMIRREVSPQMDAQRTIFVSFDGVNFGISDHVARAHAVILEGHEMVANFGTWINPMADLGSFGERHEIPVGGLALAPTLGDFWPLLLRQAAGGIVIADGLPMVERAVRHQERGMDLALGIGYDISEFNLDFSDDNLELRCLEMADAFRRGQLDVSQGQVVPSPSLVVEGAVFNPDWAPRVPMQLDPRRATASDRAWAAYSFGPTDGLDQAEVLETAELLAAWAVSRGYWNEQSRAVVVERARRAGLHGVDLPGLDDEVDIPTLLVPGTRVAFTGRKDMLGEDGSKEFLTQACKDVNLEFKSAVSKTRCDVLVASDPASMSRKAQNAREFGKPIITVDDFEHWYHNGPFVMEALQPQPEEVALSQAVVEPEPESGDETVAVNRWVAASEFFEEGTRISFRGSTVIRNQLYPQGEVLQELCDKLGLEYKQAVTKTRCDVLVTDAPDANDGKMRMAARYDKPLILQSDFAAWASDRLAEIEETERDEEEISRAEASIPEPEPERVPIPKLEPEPEPEPDLISEAEREQFPFEKPEADARPAYTSPTYSEFETFSQSKIQPSGPDLVQPQWAVSSYSAVPGEASQAPLESATTGPSSAAKWFKYSGTAFIVSFIVMIISALVGLIPLSGIAMLAGMVLLPVIVITGIIALIGRKKR